MKKIQFLEDLEGSEADLLILGEPSLQKKLDQHLEGAISYNLQRFSLPVCMTTNGMYPIPKLMLIEDLKDLENVSLDTKVVLALDSRNLEKRVFDLLKSHPEIDELSVIAPNAREVALRFQRYQALLQGIFLAKEIISAPANLMTPKEVARRCLNLEKQGVIVEILEEHALWEVGAHALLAVGQGSSQPPRMVILEWKGSSENPIALVGKGICYDAGGINLKSSHLLEMKWDKAGAGAVLGVIDALSRLKAPVHVIGILVLAENMPDGAALKPGDVIDSLGGKRIEVIDTDCEGRLALADGIAYAQQKFSPRALIDVGTLTLETFGALGGEYAGLFCNDENLKHDLIRAGEKSGEKLWPLPLGEYYAKQIRSRIADLKNVGVFRYGASSAAAEFLRAFVKPELPWAHLDISGVAWKLDAPEEGVTAFGVELLVEYLLSL